MAGHHFVELGRVTSPKNRSYEAKWDEEGGRVYVHIWETSTTYTDKGSAKAAAQELVNEKEPA